MSDLKLTPRSVSKDAAVHALAQAIYPGKPEGSVQIYPLDAHYMVVPEDQMMQAVRACHVDAVPYVPDVKDCDLHSRLLYALMPSKFSLNCIGMVCDFSGEHSYNVVVIDDGKGGVACRWVEPQSCYRNQTAQQTLLRALPRYRCVLDAKTWRLYRATVMHVHGIQALGSRWSITPNRVAFALRPAPSDTAPEARPVVPATCMISCASLGSKLPAVAARK